MGPLSSQGSPRQSSLPSVRPTLSGSPLVLLLLLLALLPTLQGVPCPASPGQGVGLLSAPLWLDPTGGALFPAVALRLPTQASPASLECPANPPSAWRPLSLQSSIETPGPQRR